jgi:hypothetical protein
MAFVDEFTRANKLTQVEEDVLRQVGVRSNEDVDSLVKNFPSIVETGVRLPVISNAVAQHLSAAYTSVAEEIATQPPPIGLGANPPPVRRPLLEAQSGQRHLHPSSLLRVQPLSICESCRGRLETSKGVVHVLRLAQRPALSIFGQQPRAQIQTIPSNSSIGRSRTIAAIP